MDKRIIAQVSDETLRLQALVSGLSPGDQISYVDIQKRSGVSMDGDGKGKLRVAVKRAGLISSCVRGWGIQMASAKSVMPILSQKVRGIDRAVRRADRTHSSLQEQFFASLTPEEQKNVLFCGAIFGAIRVAASNGRLLYSKKRGTADLQTMIRIPLPKEA